VSVEKTTATFRMGCTVKKKIQASPDKIWGLLTDAAGFSRWNSTVTSIEGRIAEGEVLRLKVPYAASRTFRLKVSAVEPGRKMVWSDGVKPMFRGVRTFVLEPNSDGSTNFSMSEAFSGLMLPFIKGSLPDFGPLFETYAEDLRRAAEGAS
jgi:hypothetical protein